MNSAKQLIKESIAYQFLTGRDMKALYWYSLAQFIAAGGDILIGQLTTWDPDNMLTVAVGLIISRITKKINSKS